MTSTPPASVPPPVVAATATHCPYCALQCGTELVEEGGGGGGRPTIGVRPTDFPVNRGRLCQKGWTAPRLLSAGDRLLGPLVRDHRGGPSRATDWPTALDRVVAGIRAAVDRAGADSIAVLGGGGLTNEKAYLLGKFARVALGTSQIDYNGRFCMSSAAAAGNAAFGVDRGLPFPVTDLEAAEVVLLVGANPAETMPPLMARIAAADLVVVDPRRTPTAERAALHLRTRPGTDLALALGLLHVAVVDGHVDRSYVRDRTTGFDEAWRHAVAWWPERTEQVTGVPVADQRAAVRLLAAASRRYVLTGRGAEQHSTGTDTVSAVINLALALGLPGRRGSGYGCLTGQGNGQGGREHGQKADQLPGYRSIEDPSARNHVAGVWGVRPEDLPGPGRSAYELLDALGGPDGPRALLVFGTNPVVSAPRAGHVTERLAALDLLVVADFVPSETTRIADVVLPTTQWAEEDGTMTNLEGRVLRRRAAVPPPPGVRTDLEVLSALATRLGQPAGRFPTRPEVVFAELAAASAGGRADYSGIDYDRLDRGEALHWPCPRTSGAPHPGTPRLFLDRFAHPDGRARFRPVAHRPGAEPPDDGYPLYGTTGRVLAHYQSGAQTRRVPELASVEPVPYVEVHPDTAGRAGLAAGDVAHVVTRRGRVTATVRLVPHLRADTVFLPFHFPEEGRANLITNPELDPVSRMPEFKVCAVRLERAGGTTSPGPGGPGGSTGAEEVR
ncbi:molybdopterin oxidoreductase family protein [Actinoalloteichus caeruleus]|uniref:molybdopterin oxidoreductase family protein n=1 Tax=Actinoalloteichus cyanogriseus TaxID=2893586 RepID=UPI003AABE15D